MLSEKIFKSKALSLGVIGTFLLLFIPVEAFTKAKAPTGSMIGFIYDKDLKTPVENAVIKIRNIENGKEYQSTQSDKSGLYKIEDIEEGRYMLGVTSEEGNFNFDYTILVKSR